jgi:hypothetical protein
MYDELHFYATLDHAEAARRENGVGRHDDKIRYVAIQSPFLGMRAKKVFDHVDWSVIPGRRSHDLYDMMRTCEYPKDKEES